jgi:hypothetical protein
MPNTIRTVKIPIARASGHWRRASGTAARSSVDVGRLNGPVDEQCGQRSMKPCRSERLVRVAAKRKTELHEQQKIRGECANRFRPTVVRSLRIDADA